MTTTIGRIVLVTVDRNQNNGADIAPGIITRVWNDNLISVRVLLDGTEISPAYTSVFLYPDRETLDREHARKNEELRAAGWENPGTQIGAYWPPRV